MIKAAEVALCEQNRKNIRKETYRTILEQFSRKIKACVERGEKTAHLKVPVMTIGFPLYPYDEATEYMGRQLVRSGYTVRRGLEPGEFVVSWEAARPTRSTAPPVASEDTDLFSSLANLQKTAQRLRNSR